LIAILHTTGTNKTTIFSQAVTYCNLISYNKAMQGAQLSVSPNHSKMTCSSLKVMAQILKILILNSEGRKAYFFIQHIYQTAIKI
jgi:hypothetical protein